MNARADALGHEPADQLTPIEQHGQYWLKRDDLYGFGGAIGGKARTCLEIAKTVTVGLGDATQRTKSCKGFGVAVR